MENDSAGGTRTCEMHIDLALKSKILVSWPSIIAAYVGFYLEVVQNRFQVGRKPEVYLFGFIKQLNKKLRIVRLERGKCIRLAGSYCDNH